MASVFLNIFQFLSKWTDTAARKPVKVFIAMATFFGMLIIIVTPPFTGADEEAHFIRAWGLTDGNLVISKNEQVKMPVEYRKTLGCLQTKNVVLGETYTYRYEQYGREKQQTAACLDSIPHSSESEEVPTTAPGYSPATYVPQTIAIAAGRVTGVSIVAIDYLVRLSVLAAYIILIAVAIHILPNRKWALVGVALLPHALTHITNPGGDYMLYGSVAIFVAAILRSRQLTSAQKRKRHDLKLLAVCIVAAVFMVSPKGIFPGILFLPLLLFFGGVRQYVAVKIIGILFAGMIGVAWQKLVFATTMDIPNSGRSSLEFPFAFMKTMFYQWSNRDFIYYGAGMGLDSKVGMPAIAITGMNILFGVYLFVDYTKDKLRFTMSKLERWLISVSGVIVALGVVVGSFAAMHIAGAYMQQGDNVILGVQARYFYPAFFLLAIIPIPRLFHASRRVYMGTVVMGTILLQTAQLLTLAVRFEWI